MASIPLPGSYSVREARGGYAHAQGVIESPYSLQRSVQNWGGKRRVVEVIIPPQTEANASQWTQWFDDLNGMMNTFNLDVSTIYKHEGTPATAIPFRLAEPNVQWDVSVAKHFGFSFTAVEVI